MSTATDATPATYQQRKRMWAAAVEARRLAPKGNLTSEQAEALIEEYRAAVARRPGWKPRGCRGGGRGRSV